MSNDYTIICADCKERYWFGQGGGLYDSPMLARFIKKHSACNNGELVMINDRHVSEKKYKTIEDYSDFETDLFDRDYLIGLGFTQITDGIEGLSKTVHGCTLSFFNKGRTMTFNDSLIDFVDREELEYFMETKGE